MTTPQDGSNYLKIDEAARFLRVTPRTIYRRIWNGDLPASKVGGLYYIHREDLEALLESGRMRTKRKTPTVPERAQIKCGHCLKLITSDDQVGDLCAAPGCEKIICDQCINDGDAYCIRHMPDREERIRAAQRRYREGEYPVFVPSSTARLRELNFLNRIQTRLEHITDLIHPLSDEMLHLEDWDAYLRHGDQRAEIMRLTGRVMLDTGTLASTPVNANLNYRLPLPDKSRDLPLEIVIQALSRLEEMVRDGYDGYPLDSEELTPWLERMSAGAQEARTFRMVVLAATTGWDLGARKVIQGDAEGGHSNGSAFAHRDAVFYLFDLEKSELLYNRQDERARRYAELFAPLLPSEELEEVVGAVEKEMLTIDSLTLDYAAKVMPYRRDLISKAFERLASAGGFAVTDVPDFGSTLVRK